MAVTKTKNKSSDGIKTPEIDKKLTIGKEFTFDESKNFTVGKERETNFTKNATPRILAYIPAQENKKNILPDYIPAPIRTGCGIKIDQAALASLLQIFSRQDYNPSAPLRPQDRPPPRYSIRNQSAHDKSKCPPRHRYFETRQPPSRPHLSQHE